MKKAAIIMLLAAAMLPALGQAQTVNICDRTPQVRDAIMAAAGAEDCAAVDSARMANIERLQLTGTSLTALAPGDFAGLTELRTLNLDDNQLTALPEGVFDSLTRLELLELYSNQLTALPEGVFDSLTELRSLYLDDNQLTALPAGIFDSLTKLRGLHLDDNHLTVLPIGIFGWLTKLHTLDLRRNHLTDLRPDSPVFHGLHNLERLYLEGQTEAPDGLERPAQRLAAAVPLLVSASDSMRQGFVRIINESNQSGSVRILAFDDGGTAANPVEIQLGAKQAVHFNSEDLENGNAYKGINAGIGRPVQGDWRLDIETALDVRVLAFIRTNDGFLTAMQDVLKRDNQGRLAALTFNPASNSRQASRLRLVNTGANAESISIEGVADTGGSAGPVTLTLAAGESRTLWASDLENGAQGLTGMLGDRAGKWRLYITAGQSVAGVSLLYSASGHITNLSTPGNEGQ